ncbi:hypothetical protein ACWFR5_34450 [Streptomyces sp. NPDC055092]
MANGTRGRGGELLTQPGADGHPIYATFSGESRFRSVWDQLSGGLPEASQRHDFGGSGRGAVGSQNSYLNPSHGAAEAG